MTLYFTQPGDRIVLDKLPISLKKIRKEKGFTQRYVAEKVGVKPAAIYQFENGKSLISLPVLVELAKLYDVSTDELLGLKERTKQVAHYGPERFAPLFCTGVIGSDYHIIHNSIFSDPAVMVELDLDEIPTRQTPFLSVTKNLTLKQRRGYAIEVLKYISSLIAVDGIISTEESALLELIEDHFEFDLKPAERNSIAKAESIQYLGKSSKRYFPNEAVKHFLIWLLVLIAHADHDYDDREKDYIYKVGKSLDIKTSTIIFIEKRVFTALKSHRKKVAS